MILLFAAFVVAPLLLCALIFPQGLKALAALMLVLFIVGAVMFVASAWPAPCPKPGTKHVADGAYTNCKGILP